MSALDPSAGRKPAVAAVSPAPTVKTPVLAKIKPKPMYQAKSGLAQLKVEAKPVKPAVTLPPVKTKQEPPVKTVPTVKVVAPKTVAKETVAPAVKPEKKNKKSKKKAIVKAKAGKTKAKTSAGKSKIVALSDLAAPTVVKPVVKPIVKESAEKKSFVFGPRIKPDLSWTKPQKEESLETLFKKPKTWAGAVKLHKANEFEEPKEKKPHRFWKILVFAILVVVLVLVVDLVGIYRFNFRDPVSYQVAKILNLPAGSINGQTISLVDYYNDTKLLSVALAQKREGVDVSLWTDNSNKIFYRLAAEQAMADQLKKYNKPVTDKDLDDNITALITQAGSREQAEAMVQKNWNLTLDQFKDKVLRPVMMREYLREAIISDESLPITATAKAKAQTVLQLALATSSATSSDFAVLAKQYTDDEAGVNTGGEFGWVVKGQLDPQWEGALFALPANTVYNQLVKSRYGYHVIKVESKLKDKTTGQESIKLRHILIEVDVDQYIKSLLDQASIKRYVK